MSTLSEAGKYFGAQPDISQYTFPLCSATAVVSSTQGQPGWAITIVRFGKSAAKSSIAEGCACRILAPIPPGMPAPMPVVHREVLHDRVEVKADKPQLTHRFCRLGDSDLTLRRLERAPGLDDPLRMALPHRVHVLVGDGRRLDRRFQIERH